MKNTVPDTFEDWTMIDVLIDDLRCKMPKTPRGKVACAEALRLAYAARDALKAAHDAEKRYESQNRQV